MSFQAASLVGRPKAVFAMQRRSSTFSRATSSPVVCSAQPQPVPDRRAMLQAALMGAVASQTIGSQPALAGAEMDYKEQIICDADCVASLDSIETVTTSSGLQYKDIKKGKGQPPPTGYQVTVHYIAMTTDGKVFASSYEGGKPFDVRVGAGQIIPGLDEGLLTMKTGGVRRLYIPGELSFPKGLASAPGRPRIPPNAPVIFDVSLLYIPGFDYDDDEE